MEGPLRVAMEYLQAAKRIQEQFYKSWTANRQRLYAERCYIRTSRFFIRTHYDDRNDATTYI